MLLAAVLLSVSGLALAGEAATALIAPLLPEMSALRRDFHQHPELSNREKRTAGIVAQRLRELGYEVRTAQRWTASEDFPHLVRLIDVSSVYFFVGATPVGQDPLAVPGNHSPRFFLDEGVLATGATGMLQAALDFLQQAPTPAP